MSVEYKKMHGLEMADASHIKNAVVESFASNPTPTVAGRWWFNTTLKEFMFSGLDGGGGVITEQVHSKADFDTWVALLAATATGGPLVGYSGQVGSNGQFSTSAAQLDSTLDTITLAIDADRQEEVDWRAILAATTATNGTNKVGYQGHAGSNGNLTVSTVSLKSSLDQIIDAIDQTQQDIIDNASSGGQGLSDLQAELDVTQNALGTMINVDGTFNTTALDGGNYMDASTDVASAALALDTQIKVNADGLAQEIIDRGAADDNIQAELDATQASMGAMMDANGDYVAHVGSNYLGSNSDVAEDLTDLDSQLKTVTDGLAQELIDRAAQDALLLPLAGGTMSGGIAMGSQTISNMANPSDAQDAATKIYVDNLVTGITAKYSVRYAVSSNVADLGAFTVEQDGVTGVADDRVLLFGQTDPIENGLYIVGTVTTGSAALTRADDFDGTPDNEVPPGAHVFVSEGTLNGNNGYSVTSSGSLAQQNHDVGTDDITFTQSSGAGQIIAGNGLSKNGNELYINFGAGIEMRPNDEVGVDVRATGGVFCTVDGTAQSDDAGAELAIKIDTTDATHGATLSTSASGARVAQAVIDLINTNESGLAQEITDRGNADTAIQAELDDTQAAMGAMMDANGDYVAHIGSNYLGGNSNVAEDLTDLDTQVKTNTDGLAQEVTDRGDADTALQAELDATQAAMGAMMNASGNYVAHTGKNYINGNADVASDLIDLDAAIGANVSDGNYILAANTVQANIAVLDAELGSDADGNYTAASNTRAANLAALDTAIGANLANGNYVLASNKVQANITALDTAIGANVGDGDYILAANKVQQNITALDVALAALASQQAGDNSALQTEVDNIETAGGAMINTDGTFNNTALNGSNWMGSATTVQGALEALDTEVGANLSDGSYVLAANTVNANLTALDTGLDTEVTNRTNADTAIRADVNAQKYTYEATSAATSYSLAHNLNTSFPQITVLVQDEDLLYYNHGVLVRIDNADNITITLTESRKVKVMVQKMENIPS